MTQSPALTKFACLFPLAFMLAMLARITAPRSQAPTAMGNALYLLLAALAIAVPFLVSRLPRPPLEMWKPPTP